MLRIKILILFIGAMCTHVTHAQYLSSEDSLALSHILSSEGEVLLRLDLNETVDGSLLFADLKTANDVNALDFDNTLPFIKNVSEEGEDSRLTLHRVYSSTNTNKEPAFKSKAERDWEQWIEKNSDICSGFVQTEGFKFMGLGRPAVAGSVRNIGLNSFFTKTFWDFKGNAMRKKTIEVLRIYGESTDIEVTTVTE